MYPEPVMAFIATIAAYNRTFHRGVSQPEERAPRPSSSSRGERTGRARRTHGATEEDARRRGITKTRNPDGYQEGTALLEDSPGTRAVPADRLGGGWGGARGGRGAGGGGGGD